MKNNIFLSALKYITVDIVLDILYFPIWWYSKGLQRVLSYVRNSAAFFIRRRLALGVWLKSMFKPMFGDYTKEGRIISFFMRVIVLIWKLVITVVWLVCLFVLVIIWIILPPFIIYYILYQAFNVPLFFM